MTVGVCTFNARHVMAHKLLRHHMAECPSRDRLVQEIRINEWTFEGMETKPTGPSTVKWAKGSEDWVEGYNFYIYITKRNYFTKKKNCFHFQRSHKRKIKAWISCPRCAT